MRGDRFGENRWSFTSFTLVQFQFTVFIYGSVLFKSLSVTVALLLVRRGFFLTFVVIFKLKLTVFIMYDFSNSLTDLKLLYGGRYKIYCSILITRVSSHKL